MFVFLFIYFFVQKQGEMFCTTICVKTEKQHEAYLSSCQAAERGQIMW